MAHVSQVQCCFASTETVGLLGTGAQDGHLDFHTAPEIWPGADDEDVALCVSELRSCVKVEVDVLGSCP